MRGLPFHIIHRVFNGEQSPYKRTEARMVAGLERLTPRQVEKICRDCHHAARL